MAERKESSVLFSLRELRSIEEERIAEEEAARRRAEDERRRAVEEAERRAREEQEARRAAAEEAERRGRDEVERRHREERLRVEEAERRARVEAQASLEQQRLHKEMELRAMELQKKRPTALIAIATILLLAVGGLGFLAYKKTQETEQLDKQLAALQAQMQKTNDEVNGLTAKLQQDLEAIRAAKTEEERKAAEAKAEETKRKLAEKQQALDSLRKRARERGGEGRSDRGDRQPKSDDKTIKTNCDPNDPLCGLPSQ
jgi:colicin import membrane protein